MNNTTLLTHSATLPSDRQTEQALLKLNWALVTYWRQYDPKTPVCNISWNEYYYIEALREGPLNLSELAQKVGVSKPSASNMVTKLEKQKIIRKMPHPESRRIVMLELTEHTEEQLRLEWPVYQKFLEHLQYRMPRELFDQFSAIIVEAVKYLDK